MLAALQRPLDSGLLRISAKVPLHIQRFCYSQFRRLVADSPLSSAAISTLPTLLVLDANYWSDRYNDSDVDRCLPTVPLVVGVSRLTSHVLDLLRRDGLPHDQNSYVSVCLA